MWQIAVGPFGLRAAAVCVVLGLAGAGRGQELPSDLERIPRQAAGFIHVRAADLYRHEAYADLRSLVDKAGPEAVQAFARKCPLEPANIDRVTLLFLTPKNLGEPFDFGDPEGSSAIIIVRTRQPYDRLRLLEAVGLREKLYRRHLYYFHEDLWSGLVLLDERTFLIGAEDSIVAYFDQLPASEPGGPLQPALRTAAAGPHHVVVGVNPALLAKEAPFVPPNLQGLVAARCGTVTFQVGKELRLELRLDYDQAGAAEGEKAVKAALQLARQGLAMPIAELEKLLHKDADRADPGAIPENLMYLLGLGYLRELDALLARTPVERQGNAVRVPLAYHRPEWASMSMLSLGAISLLGTRASTTFQTVGRAIIGNEKENPQESHLKKIHQALEKYHADKGSYPPPALLDADGRPILSWRVAILPYLGDEGKTLYSQFRLDEPWDSLHNKRLIKLMPPDYQPIAHNFNWRSWRTGDVLFVGPGAAFSPKEGRKKADVPPTAILLAHADQMEKGIYWTKPADLAYAPGQPLPRLFEENLVGGQDSITVMLANGTFRTINPNTPERELRQLIEGKK